MNEGMVNYVNQGPLGFPSGQTIDIIAGEFIRTVMRQLVRETGLEIDPWKRDTANKDAAPGDLYVHFLTDGYEREALVTASIQNMIKHAVESWAREMSLDAERSEFMSERLKGLAEFCLKMAEEARAIEAANPD
jgi:hypothetical protein